MPEPGSLFSILVTLVALAEKPTSGVIAIAWMISKYFLSVRSMFGANQYTWIRLAVRRISAVPTTCVYDR